MEVVDFSEIKSEGRRSRYNFSNHSNLITSIKSFITTYGKTEYIKQAFLENRRDVLIGISTILLCNQALLFSQITKHRVHDSATSISITLLFELSKLFLSLFLFSINLEDAEVNINFRECILFSIPAMIYLLNDNLMFWILSLIDEPTTFEILANMRVLTTSVLHRVVFKRPLHKIQWAALVLLCIGSATSQLVTCGSHIISNITPVGFFSVAIYSLLSALGGISVEYVMKRKKNESFYLQNIQLHLMGVIINSIVLLVFHASKVSDVGLIELAIGRDYLTALVIVNHSLYGLSISAIIKYCDAIARVYAHSMGMLLTMAVSSALFWEMPSIQLLFGASIVSISLYLFYTDLEEKKSHDSYIKDYHDQ